MVTLNTFFFLIFPQSDLLSTYIIFHFNESHSGAVSFYSLFFPLLSNIYSCTCVFVLFFLFRIHNDEQSLHSFSVVFSISECVCALVSPATALNL